MIGTITVGDGCTSGIYDCAGVCDGTATEDCAGSCGGTAEALGCCCGEAVPSGCDNVSGSTTEEDDCGVCGGSGAETCFDGSTSCDGSCPEEPAIYVEWNLDNDDGCSLSNNADYQYSGSVTASVTMDGDLLGSDGDLLGAFIDGEIRGVACVYPVDFGPNTGSNFFLSLIYSNSTQGETISFKYYSYGDDTVYDISETIAFESDMTLGDLFTPVALTISTTTLAEINFGAGWSWFCINVVGSDMGVNEVLSIVKGK